jgi:Domain of unknown function (DUF4304)
MGSARDFKSFAKASQKLLEPVLAPLGWRYEKRVFARPKPAWVDVIGLQQSQFESGDFCVNLGVNVPALGTWWQLPEFEGLAVASRLSAKGYGGHEEWFAGSCMLELTSSIERVAAYLERAEPWFGSINGMYDVASLYARQHGLSRPQNLTPLGVLSGVNYAFLLAEAGDRAEARQWLQQVQRLWSKGSRRSAPLPAQVKAVQYALATLAP